MTTRLYIAGPMTGLPAFNYPAFNAAELRLSARGYSVLNPARWGLIEGATWVDYMRLGIRDVTHADGIAVLPGWEGSRGAFLEVTVARGLELPIRNESDWASEAAA